MEHSIDYYANNLGDSTIELDVKANIAVELQDSMESLCTGGSYPNFLAKLWPVLKRILEEDPVFVMSWKQKLRNCVLKTLHRLPLDSTDIGPYAADMVDLLIELVRVENEENAILCIKTIEKLEVHQIKATQSKVQPFFDLVREMYLGIQQVVHSTFNPQTQSIPNANVQNFSFSPDHQATHKILRGIQSFKVLGECPVIVVAISRAHRNMMRTNVKLFASMKKFLLLQAEPQRRAHTEAAAQGRIFTNVCKEIMDRGAFGEFIKAQVRVVSFFAYLLRIFEEQLKDFLPILPIVIIRLLQDCPQEKYDARKELLVAVRHIMNAGHREIFLDKIDELLDEQTLLGDDQINQGSLQPLAYSLLADLIHYNYESLNIDQIRQAVMIYTKKLNIDYLVTPFSAMSSKLLTKLAGGIFERTDKQNARYCLIMILDAIADKFAVLNHQYDNAVQSSRAIREQQKRSVKTRLTDRERPTDYEMIDIFSATPINLLNVQNQDRDPVSDNKFLLKHLVDCLNEVFHQLKTYNPERIKISPENIPVDWAKLSHGYNAEEVTIIKKLLREGAQAFKYYRVGQPCPDVQLISPLDTQTDLAHMSEEEKKMLELFGSAFYCIDTAAFYDIFKSEIPHLHKLMLEHRTLLYLLQVLLECEASPAFTEMLLQYLICQIHEVGSAHVVKSTILLRMFMLLFKAVALYKVENAPVLCHYVTKVITKCLALSVTAEEPMNYFLLLKPLFQSISGGGFELLYKEISPLFEMLLETFNNLLLEAQGPRERDTYVELAVIVPAQLSGVPSYLGYQIRPIVVAIHAGSDLAGPALTMLESWIDTTDHPDHRLDSIMVPIIDELMAALRDRLRPNHYNHFRTATVRILGKIGDRYRKSPNYLSEPSFHQDFNNLDKEGSFPVDIAIDLAVGKLMETPFAPAAKVSDQLYKEQAYRMLSSLLILYINGEYPSDDPASIVRPRTNDLADGKLAETDILEKSGHPDSVLKKTTEVDTLKKLFKAFIFSITIPEFRQTATVFVADVCRHIAASEVGRAPSRFQHAQKFFDTSSSEGSAYLDSRLFAEALVESFSSDKATVRVAAEHAMIIIRDSAATMLGSSEKVGDLPFFQHLATAFCRNCHAEEWFSKAGGSLGIHLLATTLDLGDSWLLDRQAEFIQSLIYVIEHTPQELPASRRILSAQETLDIIFRRCSRGLTKEDLKNEKSPLYIVYDTLIYNLSHKNKHVRGAAQSAFICISEVIGCEVYELMPAMKDYLLQPILCNSLQALPSWTQYGFIEAVAFRLSLQKKVITFDDRLDRLLIESLSLTDTNNENEFNTVDINLRLSCLRLLSVAMSLQEFTSTLQKSTRVQIISAFFKCLCSESREIIEVASAGLEDILTQTPTLPKDLLQNCLYPILYRLLDLKSLSVASLEGLARLLPFISYIEVDIGARLSGYIKEIASGAVLQKASFDLLEQSQPVRILAATLNIFCLLPPGATSFMEQIVTTVLDLEEKLGRTSNSPLRVPLVKYLNRHQTESCAFFQANFRDEKFGRLFAQVLAYQESEPLRSALVADTERFIAASFDSNELPGNNTAVINAISVVHSTCLHDMTKGWLQSNSTLKHHLFRAGQDLKLKLRANTLPIIERLRVKLVEDQLIEVLTIYLSESIQDLDFLFEIINAVSVDELNPNLTFQKFLYHSVITNKSIDYRHLVIMRCLDLYGRRTCSQKMKAYLLHNLVNPIIAMDVKSTWNTSPKDTLLDKSIIEFIHNRLWKPQLGDITEESNQPNVHRSRMGLLQLSALLIKYHHTTIQDTFKYIIKFGWNYSCLEDIFVKHGAYVLISYLISHYEIPSDDVIQIYVRLLKASQLDTQAMAIKALEVLAPVLPKRIQNPGDICYPLWAQLPRQILTEDFGDVQQMKNIFEFLVRQPELFYTSRKYFVPLIVPLLIKIAPTSRSSSSPKSSEKLALNLVGLVWKWEEWGAGGASREEVNEESIVMRKRKFEVTQPLLASTATAPPTGGGWSEYVMPPDLRVALFKYMVEFIAASIERFPVPACKPWQLSPARAEHEHVWSGNMCVKAVFLFRDMMSHGFWTDIDIGLCQKTVGPILTGEEADMPDEPYTTKMINALQIMRVLLAAKPDWWVINYLPTVQTLFKKALRLGDPEVQESLHGVEDRMDTPSNLPAPVRRILNAKPEEQPEIPQTVDIESTPSDFVAYLSAIATETLSEGNHISCLNILWTLSKYKPSMMDRHIPQVMKLFSQKLVNEHIVAFDNSKVQAAGTRNNDQKQEFEIGVDLLSKTIDLISVRMSHLGEQRRLFLCTLARLIERSSNATLCSKILGMVESWIFNPTQSWPTLDEKTALLHKILLFEPRQDQTLLRQFLESVIRVYEDPQSTGVDLAVQLNHALLVGTTPQDVKMRNSFMGQDLPIFASTIH